MFKLIIYLIITLISSIILFQCVVMSFIYLSKKEKVLSISIILVILLSFISIYVGISNIIYHLNN
jgi:heme A synthase